MFELPDNSSSGRIDLLSKWLLRIAIAVGFLAIGRQKFGDPYWIRLFDQIGFGQWFRVLTGTLQMSGAIMVLMPRTFLFGIAVLASTMLGAALAWIVLLGAPANALFPGTLLLILLGVGAFQRP